MQISELQLVHVLRNAVVTYIIYKLINVFLAGEIKNKKMEIMSYIAYYFLSLFCFFVIHIPIIRLVFNMAYFGLLTLNYKVDIKQRLLTVVYLYSILFSIEMLVAAITGYIHFPLSKVSMYSSILGEIANQFIGLLLVSIITSCKKAKKSVSLPFIYWFCIIIIPIFSLYFLVMIFDLGNISRIYMVLSICFLLIINFSIMILYDLVINAMTERTRGLLLEQQNKYYERQLKLMQASIKLNNTLHHDLREHLISVRTYFSENCIEEGVEYINKMIEYDTKNSGEFSNTGNAIIDTILNLKMQEASHKNILFSLKINIPERLKIDSFDITIILGNILDNAIEAACKLDSEREIKVLFVYNRRRLILKVENTYSGEINIRQGKLITNKADKSNHGIGIQNASHAVEKYKGTIDIDNDEKWFRISVMIYI